MLYFKRGRLIGNRCESGAVMRDCPSNEELVLRVQRGDGEAFEELAARYRGLIGRRAAGMAAHSPGGYDSEDLKQEGLIGLMSAARAYRPGRGAEFGTFAALCIERRMCSLMRRTLAQKQVPAAAVVSLRQEDGSAGRGFFDANDPAAGCFAVGRAEESEKDPESVLIRKEDWRRLQRRLSELVSPFERTVLRFYLDGFSYREIAAELHCTSKAVDNALQRVRRKLN